MQEESEHNEVDGMKKLHFIQTARGQITKHCRT